MKNKTLTLFHVVGKGTIKKWNFMQRKEKDIGIADFADFSIVVTISDIQGLAICLFRCFLAVPTFDVALSIRGSVF